MKKRGQLVVLALMTLVIAIVIAFSFPAVAKQFEEGRYAKKLAATSDLALLLNTICSYPQDTELTYELDLTKFIVSFSEQEVKLYTYFSSSFGKDLNVKSTDILSTSYPFSCDQSLKFALDRPKKIRFTKTNGKININKIE